jgi:hypothetical protein
MSLRIRRGLSTDIPTPVEGELLYTTDEGKLYIGYNDPEEGEVVPKLTGARLIDDNNPTLSSDLDLAGNNITGVGNITIDGTVNATGNINLGDQNSDTININGQINTSLIPTQDGAYDLGDPIASWRQGFFEGIRVNGEISANSLLVTNISAPDSTSIYNGTEGEISVPVITADDVNAISLNGDLTGSVFSEDSTLVVDAISNSFYTTELEITGSSIKRIDDGFEIRYEGKSFAIDFYDVDSELDSAPRFLWKAGRRNGADLAPVQTDDTVGAIIGTIFDGAQEVPN